MVGRDRFITSSLPSISFLIIGYVYNPHQYGDCPQDVINRSLPTYM